MHKARSESWLIAHEWLCSDHQLVQVGAQFNSSDAWLVEIIAIAITDANVI